MQPGCQEKNGNNEAEKTPADFSSRTRGGHCNYLVKRHRLRLKSLYTVCADVEPVTRGPPDLRINKTKPYEFKQKGPGVFLPSPAQTY